MTAAYGFEMACEEFLRHANTKSQSDLGEKLRAYAFNAHTKLSWARKQEELWARKEEEIEELKAVPANGGAGAKKAKK